MAQDTQPTREQRLAGQLRANLRRRKAQAREMSQPTPAEPAATPDLLADREPPR